jgi:hypothetical protein
MFECSGNRSPHHAPSPDGSVFIDLAAAEECIQKKAVVYDGTGDDHYDTISAFIKSIRGATLMRRYIGWPKCYMPARR